MNSQLIEQLKLNLGANGLPYEIPIHPILVHLTLGLFIIAIAFDIASTLFPLEQPILKFLSITALRSGFYDVGWFNVLAAAAITFVTVTFGFFEMMMANPPLDAKSDWGLGAGPTMLMHGVGGVVLLGVMVAMALWRGLQRYRWRQDAIRQVSWGYLGVGIVILGILYIHGTLGAQLGDDFGFHNTAAHLLRQGKNPNDFLP